MIEFESLVVEGSACWKEEELKALKGVSMSL